MLPDGATLVANGKQALSLVAQDLRARGVRSLLAPDYRCSTMIEPFQLEGIGVRHLVTDKRALLDPTELRAALTAGEHMAVLHCETYGAHADSSLLAALAAARAAGVPVVVDATHSLFAERHDPADYVVASMRKLLPLPDGAYVTGIADRATLRRRAIDDEATELGLIALAQSRRALESLVAAEDAMEQAREAAAMSPIALRLLRDLDVPALRAARRACADHVMRRLSLSAVEVVNPTTPECGVVVCVDDADATERDLLAAGIICPISWPLPLGLSGGRDRRAHWVTLPVDHWMSAELLDRAAEVASAHAVRG